MYTNNVETLLMSIEVGLLMLMMTSLIALFNKNTIQKGMWLFNGINMFISTTVVMKLKICISIVANLTTYRFNLLMSPCKSAEK